MKGKKIILAIITTSILLPCGNILPAWAEDEPLPAAVSGYVSTTPGGFTLASKNKSPVIYVDLNEAASVERAAGDLKTDITKVTGIEPTLTQEMKTTQDAFTYTDNGMTMTVSEDCKDGGTGIIAAYDKNGSLEKIITSDTRSPAGSFTFSQSIKTSEGGKIKGFVWDRLSGMAPLTPVIENSVDTSGMDVIIGTVGESNMIDALASAGKIDVSDIKGKWECFKTQVVDNTLVIAGSDDRGTIYGIYDLSEKIGVSPWYYWADVPIGHADGLYINLDTPYLEGEPSVKLRGIFINDEFSFHEFATKTKKDPNYVECYKNIYELLLRLKANTLWPSMHGNGGTYFHKEIQNVQNAAEYGITVGSSHCEMLLRNNSQEYSAFEKKWEAANPDKPLYKEKLSDSNTPVAYVWVQTHPSTGQKVYNKEFLMDYWRESVELYGTDQNLYTVGMRNLHDGTWDPSYAKTNEERADLIEEVIAAQRQILSETFHKDAPEIPQVFVPYKEIQPIYDSGMELPEDITIMWTDDNYGYLRQVPTDADRDRAGGAGLYYHVSYHGSPNSYLWLCTTPLALMREELTKAYECNARNTWVINVGDLKPAEAQIEYGMKLARNIESVQDKDLREYVAETAMRDFRFDDAKAKEYADIQIRFHTLATARKPESIPSNLFGYESFGDEGQLYLDQYESLVQRSEQLYNSLDERLKPSFFELQLYPLRSCRNMIKKNVAADKSNLYASQNKGTVANKYADISDHAYEDIVNDTKTYNALLNGKWNYIMQPFQKLFKSRGALLSEKLKTSRVSQIDAANMSIASEDMGFTAYSNTARYIDLYNTGGGNFDWKAETDAPWLELNKASGTVYSDDRIWVAIDPTKAPPAASTATVTITQMIGENQVKTETIPVTLENEKTELPEKTYVESDGYVSIEAEHYTSTTANGNYRWQTEKDLARSGDSIKAYPNMPSTVGTPDKSVSAYVDYTIYFKSAGTFDVDVYRMPTLNERGSVKFGVGLDDNAPTVLSGTNTYYVNDSVGKDPWGKGVLANNETLTAKITVSQPGLHTLRIYHIDTGVIIDKLVITTGEKKASYFGAPESYNTTYNSSTPELPPPSQTTEDGVKEELTTDAAILSADISGNKLNSVRLAKTGMQHTAAKIIAAAYGADGAIIGSETKDITLSDYSLKQGFEVKFELDTTNAASIGVFLYDSMDSLEAVAASKIFKLREETEQPEEILEFKKSLGDYYGKQSMILITPYGSDEIIYITQERIDMDTYKNIPVKTLTEEKYTAKVKIFGDAVIEKTIYTAENYQPVNDGSTKTVYSQNFDNDISSDTTITLSGGAVYNSDKGNIKMNSSQGGSVTLTPEKTLSAVQGQEIKVISDIAYGKLTGKKMNYQIKDKNGTEIISSEVCAYGVTASLKIGGTDVLPDGWIPVISSANAAMDAGYMRYTTIINVENATVNVTVTNTKSNKSVSYRGRLPQGVKDVAQITFNTNYTNSSRCCYIDNVSILTTSLPQYAMDVTAFLGETPLAEAAITVTDKIYGTDIPPSADGKYLLCEGEYNYKATYNNEVKTGSFEVFPAMESDTVKILF